MLRIRICGDSEHIDRKQDVGTSRSTADYFLKNSFWSQLAAQHHRIELTSLWALGFQELALNSLPLRISRELAKSTSVKRNMDADVRIVNGHSKSNGSPDFVSQCKKILKEKGQISAFERIAPCQRELMSNSAQS